MINVTSCCQPLATRVNRQLLDTLLRISAADVVSCNTGIYLSPLFAKSYVLIYIRCALIIYSMHPLLDYRRVQILPDLIW